MIHASRPLASCLSMCLLLVSAGHVDLSYRYYSLTANSYLNYPSLKDPAPGQAQITQEQYNDIVTQHLTELWTNYGELTEICALAVPSSRTWRFETGAKLFHISLYGGKL